TVTGDSITGASYHFSDVNNYVKKRVSGYFDPQTKKLYLRELEVTTFKIPSHCKICIKNFELSYSRTGDRELLTGGWNGKILGTGASCESNGITLSRARESAFKEIPEIAVDTGEIRLDFYDNGEIDGDSITVLINKQVVISHQRLTAKPITSYVRVDPQHPFQEVEMVAENLGSIPPNTALLIITAGARRYQLFLTSTQAKSAQVRFLYEKPKEPPEDMR
ncbi:MAG TPA: hypothetical protein VHK69_20190, partial [Chitinophagaceae bacterium]|nr:hypothetical protein [Chitinophagaceae bacterium]